MITKKIITQEIKKLYKILEEEEITKQRKGRINNQIEQKRLALRYLETGPKESFIISEIDRLSNRINELEKIFAALYPEYDPKEKTYKAIRKAYESREAMPHTHNQIIFLTYLLNK